jgi:hypothetical protein
MANKPIKTAAKPKEKPKPKEKKSGYPEIGEKGYDPDSYPNI